MGDTITHLDSLEAIQLLLQDIHACLDPKAGWS